MARETYEDWLGDENRRLRAALSEIAKMRPSEIAPGAATRWCVWPFANQPS